MGAEVSVASVASVVNVLACVQTPELMMRNRRAVEEYLPLYDALIAAVLKTSKQVRAPELVEGRRKRREER